MGSWGKDLLGAEVFRYVRYRDFYNRGRYWQLSTEPYLDIVINDHCNAHCKFCIGHLVHKREWPKFSVQLPGIKFAIEGMGANEVLLLGGEPTINDALIDDVDYLLHHFNLRKICTTTNGHRMVTESGYAERLFRCGITHLNLSLMSLDPAKQKEISGTDIVITLDHLKAFKQMADYHEVHLRINNNVFLGNHDSVQAMVDFYERVKPYCDSLKFSPLLRTDSFSTVNEVTEFNRKHLLPEADYDHLWHAIEKHYDYVPIIRNNLTFGFVEYSMMFLSTPLVMNYNQHGRLRQRVIEGFINNLKMLPTGDLSLSWNREEKDYFIDIGGRSWEKEQMVSFTQPKDCQNVLGTS